MVDSAMFFFDKKTFVKPRRGQRIFPVGNTIC